MTQAALQLAAHIKALNSRWQPHPSQQLVLNALFARLEPVVQVDCGRKWGKALALDTPIPTPAGWKAMGDIVDGDIVFDEHGKQCRVVRAHPVLHGLTAYRVRFSDGAEIKACADHRWLTYTKRARKSAKRNFAKMAGKPMIPPSVVTTEEIRRSLVVGREWNHSIPPAGPLDLLPADLPLDPYVLGAWLGDGSRDGGRFTGVDTEIVEEIRAAGFEVSQSPSHPQAWYIKKLERVLKPMGLIKNKHVPAAYLRGSLEQRLSLLQGLMDTDGTVTDKGRCDFDNTNKDLADAVYELAVSIGAKPIRSTRIPKCNGVPATPCYRVYFQTALPAFRLPRKLKLQRPTKKSGHRFIVAVEPIDTEPMRCLTVDSPSSLYLAGKAMIPTHNTEEICYFLWRGAMLKGGSWYYFAPEQKQAKEIVWADGRIQHFGPPELIHSINHSEMRITLKNGAFIKVDGSDNFEAYRGITPDGCAYDEFKDFRPEFHRAFAPNLAVRRAPLLVCGTPPEEHEGDEAVKHYDDLRRELTLGQSLFNYPSWMNPHLDREWLRREKAKLYARGDGDVWEREYEARRVDAGSNAIFPMLEAPRDDRPHTRHVRPHAEVMAEVSRDRRKLVWQVIADPGTATVFGVLFRAINPYTRKVYRLAEIYETSQLETSTSRIMPRIQAMREELCPGWQAHGIEWEQLYDEAAAWFAAEVMASFPDEAAWTPTQKALKDKAVGLSLMKDQLLTGLTVISDACKDFIKELRSYRRKDGKIPKGNDHLIDCDRYGNDFASCDLSPTEEPAAADPDDQPRFRTPQQDFDDMSGDDFSIDF